MTPCRKVGGTNDLRHILALSQVLWPQFLRAQAWLPLRLVRVSDTEEEGEVMERFEKVRKYD